jgi:DNA-binding XRE family transcriptional regulator
MANPTIQLHGKTYVLIERGEFERLTALAKAAELPMFPAPDAKGNLPAKEYLRVSIARDIIKERVAAGLSQRQLAELAGVRVETLCRIETGKHAPSVRSVEKIDRALHQASKKLSKRQR